MTLDQLDLLHTLQEISEYIICPSIRNHILSNTRLPHKNLYTYNQELSPPGHGFSQSTDNCFLIVNNTTKQSQLLFKLPKFLTNSRWGMKFPVLYYIQNYTQDINVTVSGNVQPAERDEILFDWFFQTDLDGFVRKSIYIYKRVYIYIYTKPIRAALRDIARLLLIVVLCAAGPRRPHFH